MTSELVLVLARLNLSLSAAILLVLLLRTPVRRWCGADVAYALWVLPPLVLLGDGVASLLSITQDAGSFSLLPAWVLPPLPAGVASVWAAGAALGLLAYAVAHLREFGRVRRGAAGPAVVGIVRPRLCLPRDFAERFTLEEQRLIRAHERAHLTRNDILANAGVALARCLFWYNPLVHIAAGALRHDQEIACDAEVMEEHPDQRRPYAEAMLKAQLGPAPLSAASFFARHPLETRIVAIARGAPQVYPRILGIFLLSVAAFYLLGFYALTLGGSIAEVESLVILQLKP
jgi:beta-lactamase regulating signal transducer with metallopeptidase domain